VRGYLGADNAKHFYYASVTAENEMPCHEQIDYTDDDWKETQLPDVDLCAGNLIYFRNHMKTPRWPDLADAVKRVKKSTAVFSWPEEFMRHHMPKATDEEISEAARQAQFYVPESE
jgi:hypothetical protein